ncbi:MAG: hypothetical protein H0Z33_04870 [Bacillaceae bacterium]|nr:hypothetical protein [Bacillaceae bacterium]
MWKQDHRGAAEAITFAATFLLLMFILLQFYQPVKIIFQELILENVHRSALLKMEASGGLTPEIKQEIENRLNAFNFDMSGIHISSATPYPVQYGNTVELTILYQTDYTDYQLKQMVLSSFSEPFEIELSRSSVSREYFK